MRHANFLFLKSWTVRADGAPPNPGDDAETEALASDEPESDHEDHE